MTGIELHPAGKADCTMTDTSTLSADDRSAIIAATKTLTAMNDAFARFNARTQGPVAKIAAAMKAKRRPPRDPDGLLTAAQAAARLGITVEHLMAHVQDGAIKSINVGRGKKKARYRFAPADLDAFKIERTSMEQPAPCRFSSRKSPRPITGSASKSNVVGFTALRAARLAKKPKGSKR
jgi:hypothetical protein